MTRTKALLLTLAFLMAVAAFVAGICILGYGLLWVIDYHHEAVIPALLVLMVLGMAREVAREVYAGLRGEAK